MKVIICEKPQQMKSYSEAFQSAKREGTHITVKDKEIFGDEEVIMISALGHLIELCNPDEYKEEWKNWSMDQLPIIPGEFKMKVSKDKKSIFQNAKQWLQKRLWVKSMTLFEKDFKTCEMQTQHIVII